MIEWLNTPGLPLWVHLATGAVTLVVMGLIWTGIWLVLRWRMRDGLDTLITSSPIVALLCLGVGVGVQLLAAFG